jgi:8-oxo-dGTP pyrophosphatase MutT (NUDIX family)
MLFESRPFGRKSRRNGRDMPKLLPQVTKVWLSIPLRIYAGNKKLDLSRVMIGLLLSAKAVLNPVAFGVAGLILDAQGRVLLVRQTYMTGWRIPGGGIDRGETPEAALRRELKEEIGLSGGEARLFGLYSRKVWWLTHITALYLIEGATVNFQRNFEVRAIIWAPPNAPPPDTAPGTARRLAELAAGAGPSPHW